MIPFWQRFSEKRAAYLATTGAAQPASTPYPDDPELRAVYADSYERAFLAACSKNGMKDGVVIVERPPELAGARGEDAGKHHGYLVFSRLLKETRDEHLAAHWGR